MDKPVPVPVWRCETCSWWEPRYERAVNSIPTCPWCKYQKVRGRHKKTFYRRLWEAFRSDPKESYMTDVIKVFKDEGGVWRWNRIAPNGERVATSGEAFDSRGNASRAAAREAGQEAIVEISPNGGNDEAA